MDDLESIAIIGGLVLIGLIAWGAYKGVSSLPSLPSVSSLIPTMPDFSALLPSFPVDATTPMGTPGSKPFGGGGGGAF
jgi:hypothetical protein